jgi:hypothetical protein
MTRAYNTATTQQNSGGAVAGVTAGKNFAINGGMDIWQRGTSFSSAGTNNTYTADRWSTGRTGQAMTVTRQTTGDTTNLPNIQYCARVQRDSGNTNTNPGYILQPIETVNSIPLAGKTVTLSFYARAGANYSATSNILNPALYSGTGTDQNPWAGYTGVVTVNSINVTLTTTWQRFTVVGTIPTNAAEVLIQFGWSPTGTAGANDYFEITGLQLEVGSVATPFSRAGGTIAGELAACQRYCVAYGKNSGDTALASALSGMGITTSTTEYLVGYYHPVKMRAVPTLTYSGTSNHRGAVGLIANTGAALGIGTSSQIANVGFTVASGLTANQWAMARQDSSGSGSILFEAEL